MTKWERLWQSGMRLQTLLNEARDTKNCARWRQLLSTQQISFRRADRWFRKSLAKYVLLSSNRRYANYGRMDEVVYSIGKLAASRAREALLQGNIHKAGEYLKVMVGYFSRFPLEFPRSGYVPSMLVISGRAFFAAGRYMRGWCRLRLKAFRKAVTDVEVLVRTGKGGKTLQQAGVHDLVFAYSRVHKPGRAYRRFGRVARGNTPLLKAMIVALAVQYASLGNKTAAIQVYQIALKRWHRDPRSSVWRNALKALQKP